MDFTPIAAPTAGELQAQLLAQWQQAGISYVKDTDLRSARNHLLGALANARQLGVPDYLVNTLGFLTLMHCTLGEFDQAIATSAEVFRIGGNAQSNFPRGYGFAAAFGTLAHLHRGQPEAAKQCMLHGQQIAEMLSAPEVHVWVCFAAASYFLDQGELQLADAQAQLAVLHCQTGNITDSLATMWGMCGRVATAKRDFASAATYFQKAQENVYNELQATYAQADAGLMAEASGDYAQAERLLRPALDFHIRTCVWRYVPLIGWGLARVLATTGQLDEARITALRALQCAREIHDMRVNPIRRWLNTLH